MGDRKLSHHLWVILAILVLVAVLLWLQGDADPNAVEEWQKHGWGPNPRMFQYPHMVILYLVFPIYCFYVAFRPGGSVLQGGYRLLGLVMGIVSLGWLLLALFFGG